MKRSVFIAALSALAAGSALAQNVTVYGRVSESIERLKVGNASNSAVIDNASRLGFKGSEDIGGGLKASFLIEHGFNADNGTAVGPFWNRESTIGLEYTGYGKLRLGNVGPTAAYFTIADYVSLHNHDHGTSADAFYLYQGGTQTPSYGAQLNNAIAYTSPSIAGVVVEAQYGMGEAGNRHTTVLAANYEAGALKLGASYVNGIVSMLGNPYDKGQEFGLRGLYEMGAFTFGGYYVHNQGEDPGLTAKRNALRGSVMYTMGASEIHGNLGLAMKVKTNGNSVGGSDAKQFTIGYNHNLSKRTKLFGFFTKTNNGSAASYNPDSNSLNGSMAVGAGADVQSIAAGIRHLF